MTTDPVLHLSIPVDDLGTARSFYESAFGCRVGRVREDWLDVWFFGLQLTLQQRPGEVRDVADQGVRHFGVVLQDADQYRELLDRIDRAGHRWLTEPAAHDAAVLSGKHGGKLADPAGNVIEVKYYEDAGGHLGDASSSSSEK